MFKWLSLLFLVVIVSSLIMVQHVVRRTVLSDTPTASQTLVPVPEESASAPESNSEKKAVKGSHLTHAEESLTNRVAPVREAPLEGTILPQ